MVVGGLRTLGIFLVDEEAQVGLFRVERETVRLLQLLQRDWLRFNCVKLAVIFLESPDLPHINRCKC